MSGFSAENPVKIAIVGAGQVSDYHHVPGINIDPRAKLVAVCDADPTLVEKRKSDWDVDIATTDFQEICDNPDVNAVIIATPNFTHHSMAIAAAKAGKHIMCEKPLGVNAEEVRQMYHAARDNSVIHMSAFTYLFAPNMLYLRLLL